MTEKLTIPLTRKVENEHEHAVTIHPLGRHAAIEIGTDTGFIQVGFSNPNDLRAIAAHLLTVADEMSRQQGGSV